MDVKNAFLHGDISTDVTSPTIKPLAGQRYYAETFSYLCSMHLNEVKWLSRVNIQLLLTYRMIEINSKYHCNGIHDNIASITDMHFN
jgi:hypothetical protein